MENNKLEVIFVLQEIETKIGVLRAELKPIEDKANEIRKKISGLKRDAEQYKLDNRLFEPMSKLKDYVGKKIEEIGLVEELDDGTLRVEEIWDNEYFKIDDDGHLDYSSEWGGVMNYDPNINRYVLWRYYNRTEHNFIGYTYISFYEI